MATIIVAMLVVAGLASVASGCVKIVREGATASGGMEVAVNSRGASNVGSLEFEMVYDSTVLEAVSVQKGTLAGNAMLDFSVDRPGRVWVGMVDSNGISGDGSLVIVSFQAVGASERTSPLSLENIGAHNATTLIDIVTEAAAGNLDTPPTITFVR